MPGTQPGGRSWSPARHPRPALTATVTPQVTQGTTPPAIVNNYHIHFDPADREAARIIRTALPGIAGEHHPRSKP